MAAPGRRIPGPTKLPGAGRDGRMPGTPPAAPQGILKSNWQERGFDSKAAAQSVSKQYGLMMQPNGQWGKPTMAQFTDRMEQAGYGPQFQAASTNAAGTPVSIGGARWMMGKNGLNFTGQASDYGNGGGNAYNAATQVPYGQPAHTRPAGGDLRRPDLRGAGGRPNGDQNSGQQGRPNQGGFVGHNNAGQPAPGPLGTRSTQSVPGANIPQPQPAAPAFLPMTPQFEAGRRGLNDQYMQTQMGLVNQQNLIDPMIQAQMARMQTNQGFDTEALKEQLAQRGIYANGAGAGSYGGIGGAGGYLYNRDVQIPYGRQYQDLAMSGLQAQGNLAEQFGQNALGYNQGMAELLLNRAADAAQNIPMGVPQYSTGTRNIPGPRRSNRRSSRRGGKK